MRQQTPVSRQNPSSRPVSKRLSFMISATVVALVLALLLSMGSGSMGPLVQEGSAEFSDMPHYDKPYYMDDPEAVVKEDHGCFIWQEDVGTNSFWHIKIVNDANRNRVHLEGSVKVLGSESVFTVLKTDNLEKGDSASFSNGRTQLDLDLDILTDEYDTVSFLFDGKGLEFSLTINNDYDPQLFFIGGDRAHPGDDTPFTIEAVHKYQMEQPERPRDVVVNRQLPEPIAIKVLDEMGNTAPQGIQVYCTVDLSTGNILEIQEETDEDGTAYINFQMDTRPGNNGVSFRLYENLEPEEFVIKSIADLPDELRTISPETTETIFGIRGTILSHPITVQLEDAFDNPLQGEILEFSTAQSTGAFMSHSTVGSGDNSWTTVLRASTNTKGQASVDFRLDDNTPQHDIRVTLLNSTSELLKLDYIVKASNDTDKDGIPDDADDDRDGDGEPNEFDAFPDNPVATIDLDGDGKPEEWTQDFENTDYSKNTGRTLQETLQLARYQLTLDQDSDGDGWGDSEEVALGWDPFKYTRFVGRPYLYDVSMSPDPTTEGVTEYERLSLHLILIDGGNLTGIDVYYKTLTKPFRGDNFSDSREYRKIKTINTANAANANKFIQDEQSGSLLYVIDADSMDFTTGRRDHYPLPNHHQSEDDVTVGRVINWTYEFNYFSTGEIIDFYVVIHYTSDDGESSLEYRFPAEEDNPNTMNFRVSSSANLVNGTLQEFCMMIVPISLIGLMASRRLKTKLATVRFRDIKWSDVHVKEVFFTVKKIFGDVREVSQMLKRGQGKLIRLVYFLGITGLLLLSLELISDPKNFMIASAVYIGLTLFLTISTPVLYIYFARWKTKSPAVGNLRILFILIFPFAIISAISNNQYDLAYSLVFFFLFAIPLVMYANLMGSNWNFLLFNSHRTFKHGFDYLTNSRVSIGERIASFFLFFSILFMPLAAVNNIYGAYEGSYEDGGVLGKYLVRAIEEIGEDTFIQIAARSVAILIVLNVVILGVAMVFRVIQLQFYSSQKFSGRFGLGYSNYHNLRDDQAEQRKLIAFCFFVFFGYSVLLFLLTIYSYFAYLLPVLPYLSRDILDSISFRLSLAHNVAFLLFWALSVTKLRHVWKLKGYFDGFVIRKGA